MYGASLEADLKGDLSGDVEHLFVTLAKAGARARRRTAAAQGRSRQLLATATTAPGRLPQRHPCPFPGAPSCPAAPPPATAPARGGAALAPAPQQAPAPPPPPPCRACGRIGARARSRRTWRSCTRQARVASAPRWGCQPLGARARAPTRALAAHGPAPARHALLAQERAFIDVLVTASEGYLEQLTVAYAQVPPAFGAAQGPALLPGAVAARSSAAGLAGLP
jgi:hypothetical protein